MKLEPLVIMAVDRLIIDLLFILIAVTGALLIYSFMISMFNFMMVTWSKAQALFDKITNETLNKITNMTIGN